MRTRVVIVALLWSVGGCGFYLDSDDDDDGSGQQCGGLSGATCPTDEFCDFPVEYRCGIADGAGVCRARPTTCPENLDPVLGSDGMRYDNACFAHAAGADDCGPAPTP